MHEEEINQILDEIDENICNSDEFSNEELKQLEHFSTHKAEDIRARVAIILASFTEKQGENLLINLAKDKDSLVRVEACDSLSHSESFGTYKTLKRIASQDKNGMVRGYAISSLSEISKILDRNLETSKFMMERLEKEKVVFTRINIYKALYDMGERQYLECLIRDLNTKVYRNRCAVVNLLAELINNDNKQKIKDAIEKRRDIEKTIAVNSTIDNLLDQIMAL